MSADPTPLWHQSRRTPVDAAEDPRGSLAQRVAGSAFNLVTRFGLTTVISGLAAIAITRLLGPTGFGQYASAIATWTVLGASADFGFTLMLARDMARVDGSRHRAMLRSAYHVATGWSVLLALVMVALAATAGFGSDRGISLLVLAPAMAFNGLNPARAFFEITYETRRLLVIDVSVLFVQATAMILVAGLGLGPVAVAAVVSIGSIIDNAVVSYVAARMLAPAGGQSYGRVELIRRSAPLGLISIMTKVYLLIDLVLLGWLVRGPALGQYAAASKLLTVLAGLSGIVMGGALPGLSSQAHDRVALERLVVRVWHWLVVLVVPIFVAVALFAPLLVRVTIGHKYAGAVPLLRILCIAGEISVISNLAGTLMVTLHKTRALFIQNGAAIVLNIAGNLILVPMIGVSAAAWMTAATEVLVCGASLFTLRNELSFRRCVRTSARPGVAVAAAVAFALALSAWPLLAAFASGAVFLGLVAGLGAWPSEFRVPRLTTAR